MAELKPEDWEELDETINREKVLYTESDIKAARKEERERCSYVLRLLEDFDATNSSEGYGYCKAIRDGIEEIRRMGEK